MIERTHVAIVGAGITGLTLAHQLRKLGVPHVVFEAESRAGGVIRSGRIDGHLLEWGPQRTRLTAGVRQLVDELGLGERVVTAPKGLPLFVYRSGKLRRVPFSAAAFLTSDIASFAGKLAVLREPFTSGADPAESVAAYFTRKVGGEIYENLLGPLYGGLYGSDPADMVVGLSLGHVLKEFGIGRSLLLPLIRRGGAIDPPAACSFDEGMESLPRAILAANQEQVRLGNPVRAISRNGSWVLTTDMGQVLADRVVLSVPAPAAAELLASVDESSAAAIRGLRYNRLAVVHLHANETIEGLGYQVSLAEELVTRGVTFNASLFGRSGVYTAYLGGAKSPQLVNQPVESIGAAAVREFRQVTGLEASVLSVAWEAMPAWDHTWSRISKLSLPPGLTIAANWESRPGIPGRLAQTARLAKEIASAFHPRRVTEDFRRREEGHHSHFGDLDRFGRRRGSADSSTRSE